MDSSEALKRIQEEELDILKVFSSYCAEHNIPWFLCGGTALGAARHGCFLPWDDDIDVGLMQEDYEAFIIAAQKDFPEGYELHIPGTRNDYAPMFAKICKQGTKFHTDETYDAGYDQGIFIDVFPFDTLYLDPSQRKKQIDNAILWQRISYIYHSHHINVPGKGMKRTIELAGCRVLHYLFRLVLSPDKIFKRFSRSIPGNRDGSDV